MSCYSREERNVMGAMFILIDAVEDDAAKEGEEGGNDIKEAEERDGEGTVQTTVTREDVTGNITNPFEENQ